MFEHADKKQIKALVSITKIFFMISYFHFSQTRFPATPSGQLIKKRIDKPEEYCGNSNTNPNFSPIYLLKFIL